MSGDIELNHPNSLRDRQNYVLWASYFPNLYTIHFLAARHRSEIFYEQQVDCWSLLKEKLSSVIWNSCLSLDSVPKFGSGRSWWLWGCGNISGFHVNVIRKIGPLWDTHILHRSEQSEWYPIGKSHNFVGGIENNRSSVWELGSILALRNPLVSKTHGHAWKYNCNIDNGRLGTVWRVLRDFSEWGGRAGARPRLRTIIGLPQVDRCSSGVLSFFWLSHWRLPSPVFSLRGSYLIAIHSSATFTWWNWRPSVTYSTTFHFSLFPRIQRSLPCFPRSSQIHGLLPVFRSFKCSSL
jgi:hypothetical protein